MNYINILDLLTEITSNGEIDPRKILSKVNRQKIIDYVSKNEKELLEPKPIFITNETMEEENWSKMTEKDKEKILKAYSLIHTSTEKVVNELLEFKRKYPKVPAIFNYLSLGYSLLNEEEKLFSILLETLEKFPNYLFGKITLSEYYLNTGNYKKVPALLDNKFQIAMHYPPNTEVFHISEVRSFYHVTGRYFAKAGKIEMAYISYFLLSDIDFEHEATKVLANEIIHNETDLVRKKFKKHKEKEKNQEKSGSTK